MFPSSILIISYIFFVFVYILTELQNIQDNIATNISNIQLLWSDIVLLSFPIFIIQGGLFYYLSSRFFINQENQFMKCISLGLNKQRLIYELHINLFLKMFNFYLLICIIWLCGAYLIPQSNVRYTFEITFPIILTSFIIMGVENWLIFNKNLKNFFEYKLIKQEKVCDIDSEITDFEFKLHNRNDWAFWTFMMIISLIPIIYILYFSIAGLNNYIFSPLFVGYVGITFISLFIWPLILTKLSYNTFLKYVHWVYNFVMKRSPHAINNSYQKMIKDQPLISQKALFLVLFTISSLILSSSLYEFRLQENIKERELSWDNSNVAFEVFSNYTNLDSKVDTLMENTAGILNYTKIIGTNVYMKSEYGSGFEGFDSILINPEHYYRFINPKNIHIQKSLYGNSIEQLFWGLNSTLDGIIISSSFARSKNLAINDTIALFHNNFYNNTEFFNYRILAIIDYTPLLFIDKIQYRTLEKNGFLEVITNHLILSQQIKDLKVFKTDYYIKTNDLDELEELYSKLNATFPKYRINRYFPDQMEFDLSFGFLARYFWAQSIIIYVEYFFIFFIILQEAKNQRTDIKNILIIRGLKTHIINKLMKEEKWIYIIIILFFGLLIGLLLSGIFYNLFKLILFYQFSKRLTLEYGGLNQILNGFSSNNWNLPYRGKYIDFPFTLHPIIYMLPIISLIFLIIDSKKAYKSL